MRQMDRMMFQAVTQAVDRSAKYLLSWHAECESDGSALPNEVRTTYAAIRRLRSALAERAKQDPTARSVALDGVDVESLVSCILHAVEEIDGSLETMRSDHRATAARQRDGLGRVAVVLAECLPNRLPVRSRLGRQESQTVRSIIGAIQSKLAPAAPRPVQGFGMSSGFGMEEQLARTSGLPGSSSAAQGFDTPGWDSDADPELGSVTLAAGPIRDRSVVALLEHELEHPRLRSLHRLDVEAYERALIARDHRLALMHLASVLDAVLIDYVLPRRRALDRTTNPDSWRAGELVEQLVGDVLTPAQQTFVELLVRARRFAYPGFQLMARHAVDTASVDQAVEVIQSIVSALAERAETGAPGSGVYSTVVPSTTETPDSAAAQEPSVAPWLPESDELGELSFHLDPDPDWDPDAEPSDPPGEPDAANPSVSDRP